MGFQTFSKVTSTNIRAKTENYIMIFLGCISIHKIYLDISNLLKSTLIMLKWLKRIKHYNFFDQILTLMWRYCGDVFWYFNKIWTQFHFWSIITSNVEGKDTTGWAEETRPAAAYPLIALCLGQKLALEHTTLTTRDGLLAWTFCACAPASWTACQSPFFHYWCLLMADADSTFSICSNEVRQGQAVVTVWDTLDQLGHCSDAAVLYWHNVRHGVRYSQPT